MTITRTEARERATSLGYRLEQYRGKDDLWIIWDSATGYPAARRLSFERVVEWLDRQSARGIDQDHPKEEEQ